jgi:hypothetical protein
VSPRFRPTDAFVDESIRGSRYLMACVLVEARHLTHVRRATAALVGTRKRLHFHEELDSTRRRALEVFAALPLHVTVVVCTRGHGVSQFQARDACLAEIVRELQREGVLRLTVESRQDDRDDQRTILRSRAPEPLLTFDHRQGADEPILWVADAVAWAYGAGNRWAPFADRVVDHVTELSP